MLTTSLTWPYSCAPVWWVTYRRDDHYLILFVYLGREGERERERERGGAERKVRTPLYIVHVHLLYIILLSYSRTLFKLSNQVTTFNELIDQGTDEDSYRALTALGILTAVQSLVKATFNESKVLVHACTCICCMFIIVYFCIILANCVCMRERRRERERECVYML